jgi:hypothetical protein
MDGICAAAIVASTSPDIILRPVDYGFPFPWGELRPTDEVIMVDFSLQPFEEMVRLSQLVSEFTWIDHHSSVINEYEKWKGSCEINGVQKIGPAGCELTWNFYFAGMPVPPAVSLLGRYDVWDLNWSPQVLPFQYGIRLSDTSPRSELWNLLLEPHKPLYGDVIDSICADGEVILKYQEGDNKEYCKARSFSTKFEGLRAICCNKGLSGSRLFDSVWDPEEHDIMLLFSRLPTKKWTVSIYTKKEGIDCGTLAKKHGGGGHLMAGGWECKELPFKV